MKLWDRIKTSSKWQAGVAGVVWSISQPVLTKLGWSVDEATFMNVWWFILGLIGVQGAVDVAASAKGGKEDLADKKLAEKEAKKAAG